MTLATQYRCYRKGGEIYVWTFNRQSKIEAMRSMLRFALNPELSWSLADAAFAAMSLRERECSGR